MSGSVYERELKEVLSGNEKVVNKISKSLSDEEKRNYYSILNKPFLILRAAGSFGVDLVALRNDFSFPIEVKSSKFKVIRFTEANGRSQIQAQCLIEQTQKANIFPIYAFRTKHVKGDPWRLFSMPVVHLEGNLKLLYRLLPQVTKSEKGNYILKWDEGFPLHKFLEYLNFR